MTDPNDVEIRYPNDRLKALAGDYHTWATAFLDQLDAAGCSREECVTRLAEATPERFTEFMYFDNAYRAALGFLDEMANRGEAVKVGDDTYISAAHLNYIDAAEVAEAVLAGWLEDR